MIICIDWKCRHLLWDGTGFSLNIPKITAGSADSQSTAASPLIPWKYMTAARSTFLTFIIEQRVMNSSRLFHFRPAWKHLQWSAMSRCFLVQSSHRISEYRNQFTAVWSGEGIRFHGNQLNTTAVPFVFYTLLSRKRWIVYEVLWFTLEKSWRLNKKCM